MRIVIDAKLLQSDSLPPERIGELDGLLVAFVTGLEQHEVFVVLDAARPARIMHLRRALRGLLPRHRVRLWYGPRADGLSDNGWQARSARLLREALIASLDPDLVVTSLSPDDLESTPRDAGELLCDLPEILWVEGSTARLPALMVERSTRIFCLDQSADALPAHPGVSNAVVIVASDRDLIVALLSSVHDLRPPVKRALPARRPRLAYVSPLPPERSGISFYSAELLPALGAHYDIELVVNQHRVRARRAQCRPARARPRMVRRQCA